MWGTGEGVGGGHGVVMQRPATRPPSCRGSRLNRMSRLATSCATPRRLSSSASETSTMTASNMCQLLTYTHAHKGWGGGREGGWGVRGEAGAASGGTGALCALPPGTHGNSHLLLACCG